MNTWKKKCFYFFMIVMVALLLCGCGESDDEKLSRLQKEAEQARREAQQAQDDYNTLKNFVDKYGNK